MHVEEQRASAAQPSAGLGIALAAVLTLGTVACGGAAGGGTTSGGGGSTSAPTGGSAAGARFAELRPPGAEAHLAALASAPNDPAALANAARFYATGDVGGMAVWWGLAHAAGSVDGAQHEALGVALGDLLRRRVEITATDTGRSLSTSLAPGSTPAVQGAGGSLRAPFAHQYELTLGFGFVVMPVGWGLADLQAAMRAYLAFVAQDRGLVGPSFPLHQHLLQRASAGHLDAFIARLFGAGFPADYASYQSANGPALEAERAYTVAHPFRAERATMPDDLEPLRLPQ